MAYSDSRLCAPFWLHCWPLVTGNGRHGIADHFYLLGSLPVIAYYPTGFPGHSRIGPDQDYEGPDICVRRVGEILNRTCSSQSLTWNSTGGDLESLLKHPTLVQATK